MPWYPTAIRSLVGRVHISNGRSYRKKDLQRLQGHVNAKIAVLAKVIKEGGCDAAIKEPKDFQKWVEGRSSVGSTSSTNASRGWNRTRRNTPASRALVAVADAPYAARFAAST
jgi:hypothetical protein